jgi:lipoprotein-anchoring transpeptidase ErfK/SrfK
MNSRMKTALASLALITTMVPSVGYSEEAVTPSVVSGEEFPATDESLAVIQQFDADYDSWVASKPKTTITTGTSTSTAKTPAKPEGKAESVKVVIHKGSQSMTVSVNGDTDFTTMVTTGMKGDTTPSGTWHPGSVQSVHMSREFHAPLPWAVQITGGYYIHGATEGALVYMRKKIPHSHGCVRVPPVYARKLYDLVREAGLRNTTITVMN